MGKPYVPKKRITSLDIRCRGCGLTMILKTASSIDASGRVMEFVEEHGRCYGVRTDENGLALEAMGVAFDQRHRG